MPVSEERPILWVVISGIVIAGGVSIYRAFFYDDDPSDENSRCIDMQDYSSREDLDIDCEDRAERFAQMTGQDEADVAYVEPGAFNRDFWSGFNVDSNFIANGEVFPIVLMFLASVGLSALGFTAASRLRHS